MTETAGGTEGNAPAAPSPASAGGPDELSPGEVATSLQELLADVRARKKQLEGIPDGPRPQTGKPYKRRRYMVDLPLQLNYVGVYVSTIVLLSVGLIALNYVFTSIYERALLIQQQAQGNLGASSPGMTLVMLVNFSFFMLLLIGASVHAVIQSHRVAGPAYRLKMAIRHIHARDYDHHVQLRQKDFLHELADQVNVLNQSLKAKDLVIADAALRLDDLSKDASPEVRARLGEVTGDLADVLLPATDSGA
jgi:hypothetical protein